jgi:hypothetical protein
MGVYYEIEQGECMGGIARQSRSCARSTTKRQANGRRDRPQPAAQCSRCEDNGPPDAIRAACNDSDLAFQSHWLVSWHVLHVPRP